MSEDRWVRIVDQEHVLRAETDNTWAFGGPPQWVDVVASAGLSVGRVSPRAVRCRLRDVPPGTQIVDPREGYELVEPWETKPSGHEEVWDQWRSAWQPRTDPSLQLCCETIYRRPIRVIYPDQFAATTAAFRKVMEVSKTPQPGEWWFDEYGSRTFIHGINVNGKAIAEMPNDYVVARGKWQGWHHEPACTGWDWQPPQPEAEPEPLTLEQRVEAMEQRLKRLEYQVSEREDSQ